MKCFKLHNLWKLCTWNFGAIQYFVTELLSPEYTCNRKYCITTNFVRLCNGQFCIVCRLPSAIDFLRSRVEFLERSQGKGQAAALAECHHRLGNVTTSLHYAEQAMKEDKESPELKWLHKLLLRQNAIIKEQTRLTEQLSSKRCQSLPTPVQVIPVNCSISIH